MSIILSVQPREHETFMDLLHSQTTIHAPRLASWSRYLLSQVLLLWNMYLTKNNLLPSDPLGIGPNRFLPPPPYDYFITLNSLWWNAAVVTLLNLSRAWLSLLLFGKALLGGSFLLPLLDSACPLVPSVPACAVCESLRSAKMTGIFSQTTRGWCPELLAGNDVHFFWQTRGKKDRTGSRKHLHM